MIRVTKEYSWDMAHMLANHDGLCKNVHGHTYKMQVTVGSDDVQREIGTAADYGMVVDFKQLSNLVKQEVVEQWDHAFMAWENSNDPVEQAITKLLYANGRRIILVHYRPTAENMVKHIFDKLELAFFIEFGERIKLLGIKLWETPTSFAELLAEEV